MSALDDRAETTARRMTTARSRCSAATPSRAAPGPTPTPWERRPTPAPARRPRAARSRRASPADESRRCRRRRPSQAPLDEAQALAERDVDAVRRPRISPPTARGRRGADRGAGARRRRGARGARAGDGRADGARRPRAPLAGPTLDDVMSRVWEGLVTGLPAACPVCQGEVVPSFAGPLHGSCSSCGTTIE